MSTIIAAPSTDNKIMSNAFSSIPKETKATKVMKTSKTKTKTAVEDVQEAASCKKAEKSVKASEKPPSTKAKTEGKTLVKKVKLTQEEALILNQTSHILNQNFTTFANIIYKGMFLGHPETRHYFSRDFHGIGNGNEDIHARLSPMAKAMSHALKQFIISVNDLKSDSRKNDIKRIAAKHVSRGVKKEFYGMLGESLITALKETLGEQADQKTVAAWTKAYELVSKEVLSMEKQVIKELKEKKNGYMGFKEFKCIHKEKVYIKFDFDLSDEENDTDNEETKECVVNLTVVPVDGSPLPDFIPGQHVALRLFLAGYGMSHRNYTLQGQPNGKSYSLSLRPETDKSVCTTHIINSIHVGDQFLMSPPIGSTLIMESLV